MKTGGASIGIPSPFFRWPATCQHHLLFGGAANVVPGQYRYFRISCRDTRSVNPATTASPEVCTWVKRSPLGLTYRFMALPEL